MSGPAPKNSPRRPSQSWRLPRVLTGSAIGTVSLRNVGPATLSGGLRKGCMLGAATPRPRLLCRGCFFLMARRYCVLKFVVSMLRLGGVDVLFTAKANCCITGGVAAASSQSWPQRCCSLRCNSVGYFRQVGFRLEHAQPSLVTGPVTSSMRSFAQALGPQWCATQMEVGENLQPLAWILPLFMAKVSELKMRFTARRSLGGLLAT